NLAAFYPYHGQWALWQVVACAGVIVLGCILCIIWSGRRKYLLTGWFWFLGMLVPVIGLVQVGFQAIADRYAYLPLVGLLFIVVWGGADLAVRWAWGQKALSVAAVLVLGCYAIATQWQALYWTNSVTLFEHALAVTENNFIAHHNL